MNAPNGNNHEQLVPPETQGEQSRNFRLRAEHPRVTRLSRKVLAGGSAVALLVIGGAVLWSLQDNRSRNQAADELYSTEHHNVADGITMLPKDYAGVSRQAVPQLGPPLPGDLGRPMLAAQGQSPMIGSDPDQQRRDQEIEAARISHLFASTNGREVRPPAATTVGSDRVASPNATSTGDDAFAQNGQDRKLVFVNGSVDRRTVSPDRITKPASPYIVQAGTVIPGALITGIRSDLPGQITAQVLDVQVATLANQALNYLTSEKAPQRVGNAHPNIAPYEAFSTSDGYMILAVGNDGQFSRFCAAAGRSDLSVDQRFATNSRQVENRAALVPQVAAILSKHPTDYWLKVLEVARVPCGPINGLDRVFEDPQVRHRETCVEVSHPASGKARLVASPIKFSATPVARRFAWRVLRLHPVRRFHDG